MSSGGSLGVRASFSGLASFFTPSFVVIIDLLDFGDFRDLGDFFDAVDPRDSLAPPKVVDDTLLLIRVCV